MRLVFPCSLLTPFSGWPELSLIDDSEMKQVCLDTALRVFPQVNLGIPSRWFLMLQDPVSSLIHEVNGSYILFSLFESGDSSQATYFSHLRSYIRARGLNNQLQIPQHSVSKEKATVVTALPYYHARPPHKRFEFENLSLPLSLSL